MDDRARRKQIQQMVGFMKLEAREKASEIRLKTDHDCMLQRQKLVVHAKQRLDQEFSKRQKRLEMEQRIERSHVVMRQRMRKLVDRDALVQQIRDLARAKLADAPSRKDYPELLSKLIVQGVRQLAATEVEVRARAADSEALAGAVELAKPLLPGVSIAVSESHVLPAASLGGVVLTTLKGRIKCDNTLDSRVDLCFQDLAPVVRYMLFPSCRAEDRRAPAAAAAAAVGDIEVDLLA